MSKRYKQLKLFERREIEEGLDRGESFRQIASVIKRSASTVSREVYEYRSAISQNERKHPCREKNWCKRKNICFNCIREGINCAQCGAIDCRDICKVYANSASCLRMCKAPWVCNGCRKFRNGCSRANRFIYDADKAQRHSENLRSDSRCGIDMDQQSAEAALAQIKEALSRGLSPYEISILYADTLNVSASSIYRWIEAGYGGLTNIELERKVKFRPRKKSAIKTKTSHSKKRNYDMFLSLSDERKATRTEMDCVQGTKTDTKAILTLYNLPTHIQLCFLLHVHDCSNVKEALKNFKVKTKDSIYKSWTDVVLTDNGAEFADEYDIGKIFGERIKDENLCIHLYYCDPRQAQQKGSCEKNHSEIRQILTKGMFSFDKLTQKDLSVVMSHINSTPRASLGSKSPIQMLRFVYGNNRADSFLDAFEIKEIKRENLMLKPEILNIEREKRKEVPLQYLK